MKELMQLNSRQGIINIYFQKMLIKLIIIVKMLLLQTYGEHREKLELSLKSLEILRKDCKEFGELNLCQPLLMNQV